ncbi:MAG: hypothetical protein ACHQ4H_07100 [Ktedonobacterales bacterium]
MTIQVSTPGRAVVATVIRVLVVFDTVALLFAGIVHLAGARIPLGAAVFDEPPLIPAGIVEGLAGVVFVFAAYAVFARRPWAWPVALAAHLFAIAGFIVGLVVTRQGTTPFNYDYHRVMLVVFVIGLILLLLPAGRSALSGVQPRESV